MAKPDLTQMTDAELAAAAVAQAAVVASKTAWLQAMLAEMARRVAQVPE